MYAGAHNLANALDTVLEAARILEADVTGPQFRFQCLGEGPEKERLRRQARDLGLQSIVFEDAVPKGEVYRRLQQADMFVLALQPLALYDHGISINKLFDYLSLGRPIIFATGASNNPVAEADAGMSIPAGDAAGMARALRRIAALPVADRRRMGENGRRFIAANHDTTKLAVRLEAVLEAARAGRPVA
jgi:glycosyltransferase involved in cell wall biosynthesis